jgi:CheY-like chemotaxis protein
MSPYPILLVEDDENDIFFFRRAMELAGIDHPVEVARDGQEAIDYCSGSGKFAHRSRHATPGLIILDLNLPYKSGFEVLEWLRKNPATLQTIVVVFSSSTAEGDVSRAYAAGANSYLVKQASPKGLVELLKLVNAYWLGANVPAPNTGPLANQRPARC